MQALNGKLGRRKAGRVGGRGFDPQRSSAGQSDVMQDVSDTPVCIGQRDVLEHVQVAAIDE